MGKIDTGILGGFSGKVGNVVGSNWKGIDFMRTKGRRRKFKPTQRQLEQQVKFALALRFVQHLAGLVEISFGKFALRQTGVNSAVSYTVRHAITGVYPAYSISYADVLISRGGLPKVLAPTATAAASSVINWNWQDNSGVANAKATDMALLVAYCPALDMCVYTTGSAGRSTETDSLNLAYFSGHDVHTWIGFISEDGQKVADSLYTGMVMVS